MREINSTKMPMRGAFERGSVNSILGSFSGILEET